MTSHISHQLYNHWCCFLQSGMFISRLPLSWLHPKEVVYIPLQNTTIFYGFWGAIIAVLSATTALCLWWLGLPWAMSSGLMILFGIVLSGGLHEDGLADCCDGFWGGKDPEQRHNIMKDSTLGSYGTIALIFSISIRWLGLALLDPIIAIACFLIMHCMPRGYLGLLWALFPSWKAGESLASKKPTMRQGLIAIAISWAIIGCMALLFSLSAVFVFSVLSLALLFMFYSCIVSARKLGGLNGDCFGAAEQIGQWCIVIFSLMIFA